MGDVDGIFKHQGLFRVGPDDGRRANRSVLLQRHGIQLGAQEKNLIPGWHGKPRAHGGGKALPCDRHLMDLLHIPAGIILPGKLLRVIQLELLCLFRLGAMILPIERKPRRRLVADRAFLQARKRSTFRLLVVKKPAHTASVLCHFLRLLFKFCYCH